MACNKLLQLFLLFVCCLCSAQCSEAQEIDPTIVITENTEQADIEEDLGALVKSKTFKIHVSKRLHNARVVEYFECKKELRDGKDVHVLRWHPNSREDGEVVNIFQEKHDVESIRLALARQIFSRRNS